MTTAAQETIAVLKANGVRALFGNPGTTELALLDATVSEGMDFHLCLHEGAAVAMADGFGRASGTTGVVMVHTSVGTANTLTNLINLRSDAQPLLLIAGDKDDLLAGRGSFCEVPDLPGLVRQVAKEAWRVTRPEKMPELALRGLHVARSPTPGAVLLTVPENVMGAELPASERGRHVRAAPSIRLRAHGEDLRRVAEALAGAARPLLIAGNEVGAAGAAHQLAQLAEILCVPVVGEEVFTCNALNFPSSHPLYHGSFSTALPVVADADVVVAIGARLFMEYAYPATPAFGPGVRLLQLGGDVRELGKIYPTELAVAGEVGPAIGELLALLHAGATPAASVLGARRARALRAAAPQAASLVRAAEAALDPQDLLRALDAAIPADAAIVDESVLSKSLVQRHLGLGGRRSYFGTSGGGLGWGLPAAVGVQLALRSRRVVAFVGDGGALFNFQSLWTAAHLRLPVVVVVINNGGYMAVRRGLREFAGEASRAGRFPGSYIAQPEIDFCQLAAGLGVQARKVERSADAVDALRWALSLDVPAVIDVRVDSACY